MKSVLASVMLLAVGLGACRVTVESQTRFEREGGEVKAEAADVYAAGDKVAVTMTGVDTSGFTFTFNGGVIVQSGDVDKVSVSARVIGYGFSEDKPQAIEAMGEVSKGLSVTKNGNTWNVTCPKSSKGDASAGCELITVTVPRGTADAPIALEIDSEAGTVNANFQNDVVASLDVDATGADGEIVAQATPAVGANLVLRSENGDVRLDLPSDVSVDSVQLSGRTEAEAETNETYSDCSFPGATFDGTSFRIGTLGEGAATVRLTGEAVRLKKPGEK
jgi:hypothetical protein